MFARAFSALVLALPVLASASVVPRTDGPSNQCNTGSMQCCNSVQPVSNIRISSYLFNEFWQSFYERATRRSLPQLPAFLDSLLKTFPTWRLVVCVSHDCGQLSDWQNPHFSYLFPHHSYWSWWKLLQCPARLLHRRQLCKYLLFNQVLWLNIPSGQSGVIVVGCTSINL